MFTELVSGKIVSYPPTRYVYEGNEGRLRCHNRSDDETVFYNYISDALWYRLFPNGTLHELGANGPVFVQSYSLLFHRLSDQKIKEFIIAASQEDHVVVTALWQLQVCK